VKKLAVIFCVLLSILVVGDHRVGAQNVILSSYLEGGTLNVAPDSNWWLYSNTYTYTFDLPLAAPCTLVLASRYPTGNGTVSDSQGNTWVNATGDSYNSLYYTTTCSSGPDTVTVSVNGGYVAGAPGWFQGVFAEYSGTWTLDQMAQGSYQAFNHMIAISPGIEPTQPGELIIGIGQNHQANFPDVEPGMGFTLRGVANIYLQDALQTNAASVASIVCYAPPTYTMDSVFSFKRQP